MKKFIIVFRILLCILFVPVTILVCVYVFGQMTQTNDHTENEIAESSALQTEITEVTEIAFSPAAAKNIGIDDSTIVKAEVTDYAKSLTFPAVLTDRPGHTVIHVPSPVSGVITKIHQDVGVAVNPGDPLFDILLNQQEIIRGQTEYLTLLSQCEINKSEIERLSALGESLVPQKKRELAFEKQRIDVELNNAKKVLQLQGLTARQIMETLETQREIIPSVTIYVPFPEVSRLQTSDFRESIETNPESRSPKPEILDIDLFHVTIGQSVEIGDALCRISDLSRLTIQGKVFAADIGRITRALETQGNVSAIFRANGNDPEIVNNLALRAIDNRISEDNGTVFCYVDLTNRASGFRLQASDSGLQTSDFRESIETNPEVRSPKPETILWHFKPGQRCELNVDDEVIPDCIVLPIDAVARATSATAGNIGEMYVFEWVGNEDDKRVWRKKSVHVLHKTRDVVVIANDGSVLPGTLIATKGASFLLVALDAANQKTVGGGGVQHGDHVH